MSNGDTLFIGWVGGSPNYKELAPQIGYEPAPLVKVDRRNPIYSNDSRGYSFFNISAIAGDQLKKKVTRKCIVFNKDKTAFIQSLKIHDANLSGICVNTDGTLSSYALGGGWQLLTIDDAPYLIGFSIITIIYQKIVTGIFEVNLPTGLSIECVDGVCSIKHNNEELETYDSENITSSRGLEIRSLPFDRDTEGNPNDWTWFRLGIFCNDVLFEEYTIQGSELSQRYNYREYKQVAGPLDAIPSANDLENVKVANDATATRIRTKNVLRKVTEAIPVEWDSFNSTVLMPTTNTVNYVITSVTVPQYYVDVIYDKNIPDVNFYSSLDASNYARLNWETEDEIIRLKFEDVILKEYDLTDESSSSSEDD